MAKIKDRTGESNIMNCGYECMIIRYGGANDIDVQFKDGSISDHRKYNEFRYGKIKHPNFDDMRYKSKLGESNIMNCGLNATIIEYREFDDIDIKFEDGVVVKHRRYGEFLKGSISHPNSKEMSRKKYIGETKTMTNGLKATIIAFRNSNDIDIEFEDGTIVKHKGHSAFSVGRIKHPTIINKECRQRLGETRTMSNNMKATIVRYGNYDDIDIKFEDGTIVKHKRYGVFRKGYIKNPNIISRITTNKTKCGLYINLIDYRCSTDITVEFEDGTQVNTSYQYLKTGKVGHPLLKIRSTHNSYMGFDCIYYGNFNGNVYWAAHCTKCGLKKLLTPQEMIAHHNECHNN